jgi:hypothetical protein
MFHLENFKNKMFIRGLLIPCDQVPKGIEYLLELLPENIGDSLQTLRVPPLTYKGERCLKYFEEKLNLK